LAQLERQPLAAQEGVEPATAAAEKAVAVEAREEAPAEAVAVEAEEKAPAEAGQVDIASILGAPTVTVVRSSLYVLSLPE
jgi:predicted house-cleaning NTP pyrophosphatase (Maf/HAM1 superfamily)